MQRVSGGPQSRDYLVPAVTSVMAYFLFDERLDTVAIAGMVACGAAVLPVNRRG